MSLPARTILTDALETALKGITPDDGARTNIGRLVAVGEYQVNDTEIPCCVLLPGAETPAPNAGINGHVTVAYSVSGFLHRRESVASEYTTDPHAEFALIDAVIADIRDAIEGAWCALSEKAETLVYVGAETHYHQEGGEKCGATVRYLITTPYVDYIPGQ